MYLWVIFADHIAGTFNLTRPRLPKSLAPRGGRAALKPLTDTVLRRRVYGRRFWFRVPNQLGRNCTGKVAEAFGFVGDDWRGEERRGEEE